jgi:hypothetical protein
MWRLSALLQKKLMARVLTWQGSSVHVMRETAKQYSTQYTKVHFAM